MRILLATAGTRGDVEPFAALAARARAEGHEVRLLAPDNHGVDVEGLDVAGLGVDYTRLIESQGVSFTAALRHYRSVVRPVMRTVIIAAARAAMDYEPDVIVHHPKVLSAPVVAEALGIPHVLVEIVPALTPTRVFPAAGTVTQTLGPLNRLTYRLTGAAPLIFRADLAEVRAMAGGSARAMPPPAATLVPVSPVILRRPPDWPASVHLTGRWTVEEPSAELDPAIARFIAAGPFVFAGFGSMATGDASARGRAIVDAVRALGERCLIATGLGGIDLPTDRAGDDVMAVRAVPHSAVLAQAGTAIHHGGIGTVQAAMASATPSVIVPFIADQPFWGARLHEAGLAPAPIRRRALTSARLLTAVKQARAYRHSVADVAERMSTEDGIGAALSVITAIG